MNVDLTHEELELVLRTLKEHGMRKKEQGLSTQEADQLVARLEVIERQQRGSRP